MNDLQQIEQVDKKSERFILLVFLLGIFMGAIDSGIVSPARTIIQDSFGVKANVGVWMITIYTLAYAVSMPIVSKLADKFGRKKLYVVGISLFGFGSLLCAFSDYIGIFGIMLLARVIQAAGAGGIMPIANAVIAQSFPEEKRGTALGFVGAVYGVSTILGPTLGSSILDIVGDKGWGWLFMINVPISIIIILLSFKVPNTKTSDESPIDFSGIFVVAGVLLSLMYALTNLDFFNFTTSIKQTNVYPYLIIFAILVPIFIYVESKAKDPVINLNYFKNTQIALTLLISLIVGIGMMSMVFVPQFTENVLRLKAGKGGYFITILSIASGIAAPISGKLIDKFSAKVSLGIGFLCTIIGMTYSAFITATIHGTTVNVLIGLLFIGFGVGFTMGAPLNYLMLSYVKPQQAASGLATMSVIRSIGVTVSPSIMVGFVAHGGKTAGIKLQALLKGILKPPAGVMNSAQTHSAAAKSNAMAQMPNMPNAATIANNMKTAGIKLAHDMQNADITNVFSKIKHDVDSFFLNGMPSFIKGGVLSELDKQRHNIEKIYQSNINIGFKNMFISTTIIAAIGLILTLFIKNKKTSLDTK